jgi:hypothetical protein
VDRRGHESRLEKNLRPLKTSPPELKTRIEEAMAVIR